MAILLLSLDSISSIKEHFILWILTKDHQKSPIGHGIGTLLITFSCFWTMIILQIKIQTSTLPGPMQSNEFKNTARKLFILGMIASVIILIILISIFVHGLNIFLCVVVC